MVGLFVVLNKKDRYDPKLIHNPRMHKMKLHHNIIAAIILGLSIIIALIIYAVTPQPGRYVYNEKESEGCLSNWVFDSATGTKYEHSQISGENPITLWSIFTTQDYAQRVKEQSRDFQRAANRLVK